MEWLLQDARNHFSKVVRRALEGGLQIVTVRGERAVVVLSGSDYDALRAGRPTMVDGLLSGPDWDAELAEAVSMRAKTPS